jgi:nitroreductase
VDVGKAIRTVLAVRAYQGRPIPREAVERILEAGRLSASARNKQPWHFVLVDDPNLITQIGTVATSGPYIAGAPLAIVVAIEESRWAESDASRAIQNMILVAWSEGVGSNFVAGAGLDQVGGLLGVPAEFRVLGILPLGYPQSETGKGIKKRKPLNEVVSRNRFGSALKSVK